MTLCRLKIQRIRKIVGLLLTGWLATCPFPSVAQVKMRDVLRTMPDSLVPYMSENNRLDCIDFKDANMKAEVRNTLDGMTELLTLQDDYAVFQLNAARRMELRLLPTTVEVDSCKQIICIVDTYGQDAKESRVMFYSIRWQPQPVTTYVSLPADPFMASLDEQEQNLIVTPSDYLEKPASKEQEVVKYVSTKFKWELNFFNKVK